MLGRSRNQYIFPIAVVALTLVLLMPGSGGAGAKEARPPAHPNPPAKTCAPWTPLDARNFGNSAKVDHPYFPLPPGTQYVLEGRSATSGRPRPHRVTFTVTDLVKTIDGVDNVVVHDVDIDNGVKREAELSFFAQDNFGSVWNFGEYPEEYTNRGQFLGAPRTWISGQNATAGVHMVNSPMKGPAYLQAYAPDVDFLDCAQVYAKGQKACLPLACYQNILVTDETSPLADATAHQRKYHAPGVGIVQIGAVDDPEAETLVLVNRTRLSPEALAVIRDDALKLEQRAYEINAAYQPTPPAVHCTPQACGELTFGPNVPAVTKQAKALVTQKVLPAPRVRPARPTLEVTNPKPGDMLTPGAMVMHGMAYDDNAETGLGVDRVSLFLGDRDNDNEVIFLGNATLGLPSPQIPPTEECANGPSALCPADKPRGDHQFAFAGWRVKTPPLKPKQNASLYVYARSSVSGAEAVQVIRLNIGEGGEEEGGD
jgi:hypothetical protein